MASPSKKRTVKTNVCSFYERLGKRNSDKITETIFIYGVFFALLLGQLRWALFQ
jgi:hypothetical protein